MNHETANGNEINGDYQQDSRQESESEGKNPANNTEHPSPYLPPARR